MKKGVQTSYREMQVPEELNRRIQEIFEVSPQRHETLGELVGPYKGEEMRVLLVEDHPTTRLGIRTVLELKDGIELVGEAENAGEALQLVRELDPELVILEMRLKGENVGTELCREIKSLPEAPHVLIYTAYNSPEDIAYCQLSGADSYVHKSEAFEKLLEAIDSARTGERAWLVGVEPEGSELWIRAAVEQDALSSREKEIFALLRKRRTNPEIARELHLSPETVKTHVTNILRKLDVDSRRDISS